MRLKMLWSSTLSLSVIHEEAMMMANHQQNETGAVLKKAKKKGGGILQTAQSSRALATIKAGANKERGRN